MNRRPFDARGGAKMPGPVGGWTSRGARPEAYTVSAVNAMAKELLETGIPPLWVQGEVTGWKRHTSGHCYFGLRDRSAQIRAVLFRSDAQRLPADPEEGMEVRVLGRLTLYEARGEYQFVARELEGLGAGGLWRIAFEKLYRKLDAEGLLSPERKRPLPRHPSVVAVVTSPVGAALQDILRVISVRAPWTRVLLSPAKVQGDGAPSDLARAIRLAGRTGLADVIIVGRGGGSIEDLWAFNDEVVARAIADSPVPIISAVGHEIDTTIADLVADFRAPTPSAAAERAVPDRAAMSRDLSTAQDRLVAGLERWVRTRRLRVENTGGRLSRVIERTTRRRKERLAQYGEKLDALSPLGALRRGFAVPLDRDGRILRTADAFQPGDAFELRVVDGSVPCRVEETQFARGQDG
jgi:exodeoxyribonuclease VII large subunit